VIEGGELPVIVGTWTIQAVRSVSTQLTSHRSTNWQVFASRHSAYGLPAYKRGVTGSNPVAPTSTNMLRGSSCLVI
jgi:hypothetical protein